MRIKRYRMRKYLKFSIAILAMTSVISCSEKKKTRQHQYMPDMYTSVPYKTDGSNGLWKDGMVDSKPVAGTIARGNVPYEFENTNDGYDLAKVSLKNPLEASQKNLDNGKKMYDIYCISCHGKKGDGQGWLVQEEKIGGVPSYNDAGRAITEGSIYHVLMHGKGIMGSHSSQLTRKERWQIVQYVGKLKSELK